MEAVLWYVLTSTRGGKNRIRLLRAIDEQPRNANQLADALDLDYTTIRHHLDVLVDNQVVESGGEDYGEIYLPSDRVRHHWDVVEDIMEREESWRESG